MITNTLAPWAELAPDAGPMSADDLLALPDDGWMYELVEGRLVRMSPGGPRTSTIGSRLGARVLFFVEERHLGLVTIADGTFGLGTRPTPRSA